MYYIRWNSIFPNEAYTKCVSLDTQWYFHARCDVTLHPSLIVVLCNTYTNIRVMLSFLYPIDIMVLRSVCKQTCKSIQAYANLLTSRNTQLLNPYNIFARSVMYNSFRTIIPGYKSDKVCVCVCVLAARVVRVSVRVFGWDD